MPLTSSHNDGTPGMISTLPTPVRHPKDVTSPGSFKSSTSVPREKQSSYFPQYSQRSPGARSPALSDTLSTSLCLYPDDRLLRSQSSGYSVHSSDYSSITSSAYLTPPEFPADIDAPPYKPRKQNSNSLTMLERKTNKTLPDNLSQRRARGVRNNNREVGRAEKKSPEYQEQSCGRKSSSYEDDSPNYVYSGKRKTHSKVKDEASKTLYSSPADPVETRRWSSVEIGAMPLTSSRSTTNSFTPMDSRSSSIYHENSNEDVVEAIRARLKTRKIPVAHIETPATITLRKASGASSIPYSNNTLPPRVVPQPSDLNSKIWQSHGERKPSAYLITSTEIDSITRLIEDNLKRPYPKQQTRTQIKFQFQPQAQSHRPSVYKGFISIQNVAPADVAMTLSDIHVSDYASQDRRYSDNLSTPRRTSSSLSISQIHSARSVHEIVWDGHTTRPTLKSVMSTSRLEGFSYERTYSFTDPSTPGNYSPGASWTTKITSGGAKNQDLSPLLSPMIETSFEWSESKPQEPGDETPKAVSQHSETETPTQRPAIPVIITDEDSRSEPSDNQASSKSTPKGGKAKTAPRPGVNKNMERVHNPFISAVTKQLDVISFPALPPRQKTSDWISPLPDMSAPAPIGIPKSPEKETRRKTFYDLGLDITQGSSTTTADDHKHSNYADLHSRSMENLNSDTALAQYHSNQIRDLKTRQKSIVLQHPATEIPRSGSPSKIGMGSSIGISSGRRKSSAYTLKHVPDIVTTSEDKTSPERPGSIVKALMGSRSEIDFRRKSLSQHGGAKRVKIMIDSDVGDRACVDHAWAKGDAGRVWKGKEKIDSSNFDVLGSGSMNMVNNTVSACVTPLQQPSPAVDSTGFKKLGPGFMSIINNTIPGGMPLLSPPIPSPRSASPVLVSGYPFPLTTTPATSSSTPKSPTPLKSVKSSSSTKNLRMGKPIERLNHIEEKCPPSVQEDCVGIYITMTGMRRAGEGLGGGYGTVGEASSLCSAECESHNCDESGGEMVDWIG